MQSSVALKLRPDEENEPYEEGVFSLKGNKLVIDNGPLSHHQVGEILDYVRGILHNSLFVHALKFTRNPVGAEGIVHRVYLQFCESLVGSEKFNRVIYLSSYLNRIVRNTCINVYRDTKKRSDKAGQYQHHAMLKSGPASPSPDRGVSRDKLRRVLLQVIDEVMPDDFKKIYLMREYEGMKYVEIATALDMPMGTVMSRLYRARGFLLEVRERLANLGIVNFDDAYDSALSEAA